MCGIGCIYRPSGTVSDNEMWHQINSMKHRGPDGQEIHIDGSLGLSHARLAIQDLGDAGQQPLVRDGYKLIFNGEIYNFLDLKQELITNYQSQFKGSGDAEVLFEGLFQEGLEFIKKLNGDFSITWMDGSSGLLHLIRDRLGVKPLYYRRTGTTLYVASEIRGLFDASEAPEIEPSALNSFLALRYVRGNKTAFRGVMKVDPATIITIDSALKLKSSRYWSPFDKTLVWSQHKFERVLQDSVKLRLQSQVDLGVLISGGMDSTLIAKLATDQNKRPLRGFTCYFSNSSSSFKDLQRAQNFAYKNGLKHSIYSHEKDNFHDALSALEEPIGDSIISPLFGLIQSAHGKVKVLLSGEGADEMFAGYGHHYFLNSLWQTPKTLRKVASLFLPFLLRISRPVLYQIYPAQLGIKEMDRLRGALNTTEDFAAAYHSIVDVFNIKERKEILGNDAESLESETAAILKEVRELTPIKKLIYLEMKSWLCNYNLMKLDKITGKYGMEARVPYLDHRLVELVFSAPDKELIRLFKRKPLIQKMCKQQGLPQPTKIPFTYQKKSISKHKKDFLLFKQEELLDIYYLWLENVEWG